MYETEIAIFVSSISGIAAVVGLTYNGRALREQTKLHHYKILKEFQDEFNVIDTIPYDSVEYRVKFNNLHEKIAHLAINKIIPYRIAEYFDNSFKVARQRIEASPDRERMKQSLPNIIKWCDQKKLYP